MCTPGLKWFVAALTALVVCRVLVGLQATPPGNSSPLPAGVQTAKMPFALSGTTSCSARSCHGGIEPVAGQAIQQDEYTKWVTQDKHAEAYRVLFNDRSTEIARRLDIDEAHKSKLCLACHTNPLAAVGSQPSVFEERESGVGCESCHSSAPQWLGPHTTKGWSARTAKEKLAAGMKSMSDLPTRARVCAGCHVGAPATDTTPLRDVNHDLIAAGHPRLNFELAAYSANMPPHWNEAAKKKERPADVEGRTWAIGQIASAQAAIELLRDRALKPGPQRPWPEFSEYDCYACHHDLHKESWRKKRADSNRQPGTLPWSAWYFAMPRFLAIEKQPEIAAVVDDLKGLASIMRKSSQHGAQVAQPALTAKEHLQQLLDELAKESYNQAFLRKLMNAISKADPAFAESGWDGAAQLYLAMAALAPHDQRTRDAVHALTVTSGFQNPNNYQIDDRFVDELREVLKKLAK